MITTIWIVLSSVVEFFKLGGYFMADAFWKSKVWRLLYDMSLKALQKSKGDEGAVGSFNRHQQLGRQV